MIDWYKKVVFENYANFSGRARRSEYWYFILMDIIIQFIFFFLFMMFFGFSFASEDAAPMGILGFAMIGLWSLYCLGTLLPKLAVIVRRLHDTGRSGFFYFIGLIPVIGPILLLVWLATEGDSYENNWGKDPKVLFSDIDQILENNQNY